MNQIIRLITLSLAAVSCAFAATATKAECDIAEKVCRDLPDSAKAICEARASSEGCAIAAPSMAASQPRETQKKPSVSEKKRTLHLWD